MNQKKSMSVDKWMRLSVPGWLMSVIVHVIVLVVMWLWILPAPPSQELVDLESILEELPQEPELEEIELEPLPLEPPETLKPEVPEPEAPPMSVASEVAELSAPAPASPIDMPEMDSVSELLQGPNLLGKSAKGMASTLNSRGKGMRQAMVGSQGGTKQTEQAVNAGLDWLVRHQYPDGHWSVHQHNCQRGLCDGESDIQADPAATAFGLLPFLAAGHTHTEKGPHKLVVTKALRWLISNQGSDGSLTAGCQANSPMYAHGLASIALAEAYALSGDPEVGRAAQKAIQFIEEAQSPDHGGWRYTPRSPTGDTSVVGWQIMALKSAQMGGLAVKPQTLELAMKFLDSVSYGDHNGLFGYDKPTAANPTRTSIGILCLQYLGAKPDEDRIKEGLDYIKKSTPVIRNRNSYYWYYATQVLHNVQGADWDSWNRQMRTIWIETQEREKGSCQHGSWDPAKPFVDVGGHKKGGRLMTTSVGLLTLEVYYRYLPLYKINERDSLASTR